MKSVQTKISVLSVIAILLMASVMMTTGLASTNKLIHNDSTEIMNRLCGEKIAEINAPLSNIEQSVNILYHYTMNRIESMNLDMSDLEALDALTEEIKELSISASMNTEGAVTVYLRYGENVPYDHSGFFLVNVGGNFHEIATTDLNEYNTSDLEHVGWYYLPIQKGEATWIDPYMNKNLDIYITSYVQPIFVNGQAVGVIGMDINMEVLRSYVESVKVYASGYAILADSNNQLLFHPKYENRTIEPEQAELISSLIEQSIEQNSTISYEYDGTSKYLVARKLLSGMRLVVAVPRSEIIAPSNYLKDRFIRIIVILTAIALIVANLVVRRIVKPLKQLTAATNKMANGELQVSVKSRTRDEIGQLAKSFDRMATALKEQMDEVNRIAYQDRMTGLNNATAYENAVTQIDEGIQKKETNFAVVVLDVNNLKKVNDSLGHQYGDQLIKDAAMVIHNTFGEEVYRIGGDEFVAILKDAKLIDYTQLLRKLENEIKQVRKKKEKPYAEKFAIAVGVAVFDKEREHVYADTFRRADALMYENKNWQKESEQI